MKSRRTYLAAKRVFDAVLAFFGLVVLSPLLLVTALFVKVGDGGPVFFRQTRVGRHGRLFKIWKFRTMVVDAEKQGKKITVGSDRRVTKVGEILRKYKIDELPQLMNVLVGEMSFVGARPEVPEYVRLYNEDERRVLELKPGITDLLFIKYRNESEVGKKRRRSTSGRSCLTRSELSLSMRRNLTF